MNDLTRLLDLVSEPQEHVTIDPSADLTRGHRALAQRRLRRGASVVLGTVGASAVTVGIVRAVDSPDPARESTGVVVAGGPMHHESATLDDRDSAGPFTFDPPPPGWEVQGHDRSVVTIAPTDGSADEDPDNLYGKISIWVEAPPVQGDEFVVVDGRRYGLSTADTLREIFVATRAYEPDGTLRVNYPTFADLDQDAMIDFLASVRVDEDVVILP